MSEKTPLLPGGGERSGRARAGIVIVLTMVATGALLANFLFDFVGDFKAEEEILVQNEGWGWGSVSGLVHITRQDANEGYR